MPKRNSYKMRKSTEARIRREIRNFNQRRDRFIKNHPELADIQPPRIKPSVAIPKLASAADVKAFEKTLKGFTAQTARPADTGEGGVNVTKWELAKVRREVRRANVKREKRQEKKRKVFINGQEVQDVRKMGQDLEDKKPLKVDTRKSLDSWRKFAEYVESVATDYHEDVEVPSAFKENLLKAFYSHGSGDPVLGALYDTIPAERLHDMYFEGADSCNIYYVYDDAIDNEDKDEAARDELTTEIKNSGLQGKALENMLKAWDGSQYDKELLAELWRGLGEDNILDQYKDFGNEDIFNVDLMLDQYLEENVTDSAAVWDMWDEAGLSKQDVYTMYKSGLDVTDRNIIFDGSD